MTNKKTTPIKNIPTILPAGFAIRISDKKMVVLDFFDTNYDDQTTVVGSFAMDLETSTMLQQTLTKANKKASGSKNA